ncbi:MULTISPECIES: HDOD domain-containing protein [unclassified Uliginosibacterium]|uniref:HDOD domain-containing protein n=1 Tax=unclassified Uliginosibacterium TaxID=2621521 RepID=UPI000C7D6BAD|nr:MULTISPECIES: HDOD domain-containing protein [unclassified Uliginosibacterium]MDO6387504.1 HDOD domain-containing protein [Uliginosibacterium sp. 31-12]PLK47445.1 histidine kinase [Uliginosibacterium sp. TH139]
MHLAQELVASQDHLASLPDLYYKIRQALARPELSIGELAELIANDPALSGTLLHIANSAFYGFPRRIETLSRAISLIGMEQVGDIVLAGTLAAAFHGIRPQRMDMQRFWRGSIRRALLCRQFARSLENRDSERSFIIGLLSDMGHLVMYHAVADLMGIVLEMSSLDLRELAQKEREIIGCDFSEVGAALCASWMLPASIGTVIGSQLQPALAGEFSSEAARLNLAISMAEASERGETISAACPLLDPDTPELSGVDLALLPVFAENCDAQLESVMQSLGLA